MKYLSAYLALVLLLLLGETPRLSAAQRIVSLSPAMTELICHLGCQNRLVGRSSACNYPPQIQSLPVVGDFASPDLEKILQLSPDLVLSNDLINPQVAQQLTAHQIKTLVAPVNSLADYRHCLQQLAPLLNLPAETHKEILRTSHCQLPDTGKKALIIIWEKPLIIAGEDSWPVTLLRLSGLSVPDLQNNKGYFTPSLEWLRTQKLDALITFQKTSSLQNLPFPVLFFPEEDLLLRPSPRFTQGIQLLRNLILSHAESASSALPQPRSANHPLLALRLWRIAAAFAVGGILSLAGLLFQNLFRNPLATPYTLGISSGAATGAAVAFIFCSTALLPLLVPAFAFTGALLTLLLVLWAGHRASEESNALLLCGVITNVILSSLLIFCISIANSSQLAGVTWWTLGDLQALPPGGIVTLLILLIVATLITQFQARPLNALLLGNETAMAMGVHPQKLRLLLIITASLITAVTVSFAGIIGFVGLIIPHLTRRLFSADHFKLIIPTVFIGGLFLLFCDQLSRFLNPVRQIPIGLITAIAGGLLFLLLMRRRRT